jgi:LPXTG-motif cell wall-anchored protein
MKMKKRFFGTLLSLVMVLGMSMTAYADNYNLWIGGMQVTSANAKSSDHPTWSYDVGTKTLTLNGATISGGNPSSEDAAIYAKGELTINMTGNNTVTGPENPNDQSRGVYVNDGDDGRIQVLLTITGSGTLTATGHPSSKYSYGISTGASNTDTGDITISADTTVNAVGQGSSFGAGVRGRHDVNINGTLTAFGGDAGVYADYGNINISENAKLTATGDTAVSVFYGTVKNAIAGTGWSDTAGTQGKTAIAISTGGQTLGSYKKVQFPAVKEPSTVTKAPEAKNLTYTGSAQALVEAGTASGGTMQYALGTKDAATGTYSASIPTGTEAGTYYVWYKVKGDDNHNDTTPHCIQVTISRTKTDDDKADDKGIDSLPQTGDTEKPLLYGLAALFACIGLGFVVKRK